MSNSLTTSKESSVSANPHGRTRRSEGQILVIFALGLIAMLGGVALVIEGGNAYQQQRSVQNASDAAAEAGTVVIAESLGTNGVAKTDTDVASAVSASALFNSIAASAYYTNWQGQPLDASGNVVAKNLAVAVGSAPGGAIPPNAQGVHASGNRTFGTTIGHVIGFNSFTASAEATAVTGNPTGGLFLPVVFPVNITDCSGNGSLGTAKDDWFVSQPGTPPAHPVGTEYIVPLCKTGSGSFMVLDLDGIKNNCEDEVLHPKPFQFDMFPTDVASDNGNNCAKAMADAVNSRRGETVLVPICDNNECNTDGGSKATYHITGVAAFYIDYMEYSNNKNNSLCQTHFNSDTPPQELITISGNGSSSCIAGWFVRFITAGPVGPGAVTNAGALSIQLIQ
jgi:Flp pilus assembly protein TadG